MTKVRPAVARDSASIAMVQRRSRSAAYRNFLPPEWMEFSPDEIQRHVARWHQTLVREDDTAPHTWVAEVDGGIVGFIAIGASTDNDDEAQTYSVSALYVDPTHWRRGVGRALLRTALDTLIIRGVRSVTLWTYEPAQRARAFYEAEGWRHDGTARLHASGRAPRQVRYRLTLDTRPSPGSGLGPVGA